MNFKEFLKDHYLKEDDRNLSNEELDKMIDSLVTYLKSDDGTHNGDCTRQNYTCTLCYFELLLNDYYKYSISKS
jgi:hypothetical protein